MRKIVTNEKTNAQCYEKYDFHPKSEAQKATSLVSLRARCFATKLYWWPYGSGAFDRQYSEIRINNHYNLHCFFFFSSTGILSVRLKLCTSKERQLLVGV